MSGSQSNVWYTLGGALRSVSQVRKGMSFIAIPRARRGTALMSQDMRHRIECEACAKHVRVIYA